MILETTETQSSEQPAAMVASLLSGNGSMCGNHPAAAAATAAPLRHRYVASMQLHGSNFEDQRRKVLVVDAIAEKEEPEDSSSQWKAMASAEQKMLSGRAAARRVRSTVHSTVDQQRKPIEGPTKRPSTRSTDSCEN